MDLYTMQANSDFMDPSDDRGVFEAIQPYTNDWFQWDYYNLNMMKCDSRSLYGEEIKDHHLRMHKGCCSSNACENAFLTDCCMGAADEMFDDLPDIQLQNTMEFTDDIFLYRDPLIENDLTDIDNPNESSYTSGSMYVSLASENFLTHMLTDLERPMTDPSTRESADPNLRAYCPVEPSPLTEGVQPTVLDESLYKEATVLLELENVMLQLSSETRICIRDALYQLADSSKDQHKGSQDVGRKFMDSASVSELNSETSRQKASRTEPKTNVVDRAIAILLFNRHADRFEGLQNSLLFFKSMEKAATSGT